MITTLRQFDKILQQGGNMLILKPNSQQSFMFILISENGIYTDFIKDSLMNQLMKEEIIYANVSYFINLVKFNEAKKRLGIE